METIQEIIEKIKMEEKRKKFFMDKLKTELQRYRLHCDDKILDKLFIDAINTFNGNNASQISSHIFQYVKKRLNPPERKYPKNDLFSESEMIILELYLEKINNEYYKSSEEIAKQLGIPISEVTKVVYKFKDYLTTSPKQINKIFGDIGSIIKERQRKSKLYAAINKRNNYNVLTNEDIELLGMFTGQIGDICLDINELADKKGIPQQNMLEKLRAIFESLDNEKNYSKVLAKFPSITDMLKIKATALDISIKHLNKDNVRSTNQKKSKNLTKQTEKAKKRKNKDYTIRNDIKKLEYFFKPKEDGTYLSNFEIAELLHVSLSYITNSKHILLNKLRDKKYKDLVLNEYPELDDDIEKRRISKDIRKLQCFFKPKEDGTYLSDSEISKLLHIRVTSISQAKKYILVKLTDKEYKDLILKWYPELERDIQNQNNQEIPKEQDSKISLIDSSHLTEKESQFADLLLTDRTKLLYNINSYAKSLEISLAYFDILKGETVSKIRNNPNLQSTYPSAEVENSIVFGYKNNTVRISQEDISNIKHNVRKYDIPYTKPNTKDNLIKGIHLLEISEYKDYVSLCTMEQKAILALRLGYFNQTSFSTQDVSNLFGIEQEEVLILTEECIQSNKKGKENSPSIQKKIL